jgi:8-oxo-dGTP diphosphatase
LTLKRIRVVAALLRRGDEALVQQRGPKGARAFLWEFPGGKVEPGESESAALERECREEMDVQIAVGERLDEVSHAYADLEVELVLYATTLVSGEPKPLHAHTVRWVKIAKLAELPFCEADGPFLKALEAGRY